MARQQQSHAEYEPDTDTAVLDEEAEGWDEETLGLDWNEADDQTVVEELISRKR